MNPWIFWGCILAFFVTLKFGPLPVLAFIAVVAFGFFAHWCFMLGYGSTPMKRYVEEEFVEEPEPAKPLPTIEY